MPAPVLIAPGGGEVVGDSPERRVEILSDADALHATWSRFGPGREGADLHVHRRHADLFYVLAGELTVRLGVEDRQVRATAGTLVYVPPLVVHGFRNASDADMRYLNLHAPGSGFADYMRALRDGRTLVYDQEPPPADGGRPVTAVAIGVPEVATGGVEAIAVAEVSAEPGEPSALAARPHLRSLYVLEGDLRLVTDDGERPVTTWSWLQLPAGLPHAVAAAGGPARFLDISTPA